MPSRRRVGKRRRICKAPCLALTGAVSASSVKPLRALRLTKPARIDARPCGACRHRWPCSRAKACGARHARSSSRWYRAALAMRLRDCRVHPFAQGNPRRFELNSRPVSVAARTYENNALSTCPFLLRRQPDAKGWNERKSNASDHAPFPFPYLAASLLGAASIWGGPLVRRVCHPDTVRLPDRFPLSSSIVLQGCA
jgi:hypothetical protein